MAKKELEMLTPEEWVKKASKKSKVPPILFFLAALHTLVLSLFLFHEQLLWNKRLESWEKVQGVIQSNAREKVSSGKRRKTVSKVFYTYSYKGKFFTGKRILYDSDTFPAWVKKGEKRTILVNPAFPQESAVMFSYRKNWNFLRYIEPFFCFCTFLLFTVILLLWFRKREPAILPESLVEYIEKIPAKKLYALPLYKRPYDVKSNFLIDTPPEEVEKDIFLLKSRKPVSILIILAIFSLFFAAAAVILQNILAVLYLVFIVALIFIYREFPAVLVFDLKAKRIYRCKRYTPEKMPDIKSISFDKVDFLSLQVFPETANCLLCAVKLDGSMLPLFKIRNKDLEKSGTFAVFLAEKMGKIPIILR